MLTIVGCGNPTRGDDGLGPFVARRLRAHVDALGRTDVRVFDAGTDGMAVMFAARGSDELVIVDAARTGVEPGAIYEVPGDVLSRDYTASLNLHDFRWDHALAAGKKIFADAFPEAVTVLLVEVEHTNFGLELSDPVRTAAETVIARLEALVAASAAFRLKNGSLYVDAATFERHLAGREAVTLVRRDADLCIVPLLDSTLGGFLCKRRTAAGDRVIHAEDFFRDHGVEANARERVLAAAWRDDLGAFVVAGFFEARV